MRKAEGPYRAVLCAMTIAVLLLVVGLSVMSQPTKVGAQSSGCGLTFTCGNPLQCTIEVMAVWCSPECECGTRRDCCYHEFGRCADTDSFEHWEGCCYGCYP